MLTKTLALNAVQLKATGDGHAFSGYASVFNGVDSYRDTILPGAYKSTLKDRERPVALRWNHYGPVIGKWLSIKEDDTGLLVEGELTPGHSVAEDAFASMKHGAVDGLSIGYRVKDSEYDEEKNITLLKDIDLIEISVVEEPADNAARIGEVKSLIESFEDIREFESLLRDAGGLSRADAKAFVARFKAVCQRDAGEKLQSVGLGQVTDSLKSLNSYLRSKS